MWADPADPVDGDVADRAGQDGVDRAVPDFLAERVARDRALALDWLLAEVRLLPELQRARAAHALGLARGPAGRRGGVPVNRARRPAQAWPGWLPRTPVRRQPSG